MSVPLGQKPSTNAEDDVLAAYNELKKEAEEKEVETQEEEPPAETPEEETESEPEPKAKEEPEQEEEDIPAPNDWTAEAKEWLKKQDPVVRRENARIASQYNKHRQNQLWQMNNERKALEAKSAEIEDAVKVVQKWLPRWGAKGVTAEAALSQLCAFNDLCARDIDAAIEELAKRAGRKITIEGRQQKTNPEPIDSTKVARDVKAQIDEEYAARAHAAQVEKDAAEWHTGLNSLINETNGAGKYIYPDFHSVEFQQELEPLAAAIWQKFPHLDKREVLVRAYKANNGRIVPKSAPTSAPKLNGSRTNAAKRASASISGNLNASSGPYEAPPGETVEQSILRTIEELSKR